MARLPGRKLDTWQYRKDAQVIDVPVRLVDDYFTVMMPEMGIDEDAATLSELKAKVFAILDEKLKLEWKPYLYITVTGSTAILKTKPVDEDNFDWEKASAAERREFGASDREIELSLHVNVEVYSLTTDPTGKKLQKRSNWTPHGGWPETGVDPSWRSEDPTQRALIPDTPEAREALNILSRDLQKLNDRLCEVLGPKQIVKTLANAVQGKLLNP